MFGIGRISGGLSAAADRVRQGAKVGGSVTQSQPQLPIIYEKEDLRNDAQKFNNVLDNAVRSSV